MPSSVCLGQDINGLQITATFSSADSVSHRQRRNSVVFYLLYPAVYLLLYREKLFLVTLNAPVSCHTSASQADSCLSSLPHICTPGNPHPGPLHTALSTQTQRESRFVVSRLDRSPHCAHFQSVLSEQLSPSWIMLLVEAELQTQHICLTHPQMHPPEQDSCHT